MHRTGGLLGALLVVSAAFSEAAGQQPAPEFKTFKIVVGFSTGGEYDTYARVLARHMSRYIPGQPNIIVQNMPGGASLKAIQYLDNGAPTDGSVITAFNPGTITEWLVTVPQVVFDARLSIRTVPCILAAAVSMAFGFRPANAQQHQKPQPPQSLRLYVLDCGNITGTSGDSSHFAR